MPIAPGFPTLGPSHPLQWRQGTQALYLFCSGKYWPSSWQWQCSRQCLLWCRKWHSMYNASWDDPEEERAALQSIAKSVPGQAIDLSTPPNHVLVDVKSKQEAGMQWPKHLNIAPDLNFIHIPIGLMSQCNKKAQVGTQESGTYYAHTIDLAFPITVFKCPGGTFKYSTARITLPWQSRTYLWEIICDVHMSEKGQSYLMFVIFSKIQQMNTIPVATKNPCHKLANGRWQIWILETLDIHFSITFFTQIFKGVCRKANIKINRKIEIKLKINLDASVHCLSPPNTYFNVQEEHLASTRKFVENYLLFTCITNQILALYPWSVCPKLLARYSGYV
jgi:hypothetical protein